MRKGFNFNTFVFLRRYYNIPKNKPLKWCIVKESTSKGTELRLGVSIEGTDLYIDIAQRRMFSVVSCGLIERSVFPARRKSSGKNFKYTTRDGWFITKPKTYIMDIYRSSWWRSGVTERESFL